MARRKLPELPDKTLMVVIRGVLNGEDIVLAPKLLQASCTDERHWEEQIDFFNKN